MPSPASPASSPALPVQSVHPSTAPGAVWWEEAATCQEATFLWELVCPAFLSRGLLHTPIFPRGEILSVEEQGVTKEAAILGLAD